MAKSGNKIARGGTAGTKGGKLAPSATPGTKTRGTNTGGGASGGSVVKSGRGSSVRVKKIPGA